MAAVPMTFQCIVYPRDKSVEPYPATLVGMAFITGLSIGGGPVQPPTTSEPPPLVDNTLPPVEEPPPDHPLEEMLTLVAKAPPAEGGWGWFPEYGWVYNPGEGGAQPKRRK